LRLEMGRSEMAFSFLVAAAGVAIVDPISG
jgi:hypothetical protein